MTQEQQDNILRLIKSGNAENMELAMTLATGLGDAAYLKRVRFLILAQTIVNDTTKFTEIMNAAKSLLEKMSGNTSNPSVATLSTHKVGGIVITKGPLDHIVVGYDKYLPILENFERESGLHDRFRGGLSQETIDAFSRAQQASLIDPKILSQIIDTIPRPIPMPQLPPIPPTFVRLVE